MEQGEVPERPFNVGIPRPLAEHIDRMVTRFPELGYRNPSEFIVAAARDLMLRAEDRALRVQDLDLGSPPERPMHELREAQGRPRR